MTSTLRWAGALLVCAAAASPAIANDRASASAAAVAAGFLDALQRERFEDAAAMLAPAAKPGASTAAPAQALRRLGAELGGYSAMRPVVRMPAGGSMRTTIPAHPATLAPGTWFLQQIYTATATDGQAVYVELQLSADAKAPRLLSLALHLPTTDPASTERAKTFLHRVASAGK